MSHDGSQGGRAVYGNNGGRLGSLSVLMYHSISSGSGPTNIAPDLFRQQMVALVERGFRTLSLSEFLAWHRGEQEVPDHSIVITFDDGFTDFAECARPILLESGFTATVFLITGEMGKFESWDTVGAGTRRCLMTWRQAETLIRDGFDIGGHTVGHRDLTRLSPEELRREVLRCRQDIEARLGCLPLGFAAPYGRTGERERAEISCHFSLAMGTRLASVRRGGDCFDLPRVEMHYFRDVDRWRAFLDGRASRFMLTRRAIRRVREFWT